MPINRIVLVSVKKMIFLNRKLCVKNECFVKRKLVC